MIFFGSKCLNLGIWARNLEKKPRKKELLKKKTGSGSKFTMHNKRVSQPVIQELVLKHLETVLGGKQNRKTALYKESSKGKVLLSEGRFSTSDFTTFSVY